MHRPIRLIAVALIFTLTAASARAASITLSASGLIRTNGAAPRNMSSMDSFNDAVDASLPPNLSAVRTPLSSLLVGEGLLGGPAPGAFFAGTTVPLPTGMSLSAVAGQPTLNSGLARTTAVFVDHQGTATGTPNLYYLGSPAEGATEPNRIQFRPTDVGTNAQDIRVLRPVSFDTRGEAIEVQPGERGVLEAGAFRFHFTPEMGVRGLIITFVDTETEAALNTGIFNIEVNGASVPNSYAVPAGGNDNEYFVGFLGDSPITAFDVRLGKINAQMNGGDGVLLDTSHIQLLLVPEPATIALLGAGLIVTGVLRRNRLRRSRHD